MARRGFTLCFLFLVVSFLLLSCGRTQSFVTVDLYEYQCDTRNAYCIYNHYWNNNILLLRSKCYQKDGDVFEPHNSTTVISSALKGRKSFCQYEESVIIRERDDCIALYNWSTNSYNTIQLTPYFTYILDFVVCGDNLICTGRGTKGDVVVSVNLISFAVNELDIGTMTILPGIVVGNNDDAMFFVIKEHDVCCMSVKKNMPRIICAITPYDANKNYAISSIYNGIIFFKSYNRQFEDNESYYSFDIMEKQLDVLEKSDDTVEKIRIDAENRTYIIPWDFNKGIGDLHEQDDTISVINRENKKEHKALIDLKPSENVIDFIISEDTLILLIEDSKDGTVCAKKVCA